MNELIFPEILYQNLKIKCNNTSCSSYSIELNLDVPVGCTEVICGMCSIPIILK